MMKSNPVALSDNQKKLIQQVRAEHDDLLEAIHSLEAALASAAPGREQAWGKQVLKKLQAVAELLDGHARSAEAADGLLAMVAAAQPRLLHRVERLRREHVDLLDHARSLQRQIEHHAADELPNFRDIRQRATWLLNALRHHRAAATDLIFEAYSTDVGVGD
jgi:hemerythrin-like domain-containing protein